MSRYLVFGNKKTGKKTSQERDEDDGDDDDDDDDNNNNNSAYDLYIFIKEVADIFLLFPSLSSTIYKFVDCLVCGVCITYAHTHTHTGTKILGRIYTHKNVYFHILILREGILLTHISALHLKIDLHITRYDRKVLLTDVHRTHKNIQS